MTGRMIGGALAALLLSAACTGAATSNGAGTAVARTDGRPAVPCGPSEVLVLHHHAHVTVVVRGVIRDVPASVGIKAGSICWLHTHDASGVIHIEAGDSRALTLGDFFALWGMSLGPMVLAGQTAGAGEEVRATVNGLVASDPRAIVLNDMDEIVVQLGPPYATVPPYFRK